MAEAVNRSAKRLVHAKEVTLRDLGCVLSRRREGCFSKECPYEEISCCRSLDRRFFSSGARGPGLRHARDVEQKMRDDAGEAERYVEVQNVGRIPDAWRSQNGHAHHDRVQVASGSSE